MPEEAKKNAAEQAAQAQKQPVPMPTTYEALRHDLIASGRAYDFDMIDRAYQLASAAHATQFRRSGEPCGGVQLRKAAASVSRAAR